MAHHVVHISEAPPGEGLLDMDAFFDVVGRLGQDTAVIVEHLPAELDRIVARCLRKDPARRIQTMAGPAKTVAANQAKFEALLQSLKL